MNSNDEFKAIAELDLDPIKTKLMHVESGEGWPRKKVDAVEFEYRRFLYLMEKFPTESIAPTVDVDSFWHYHILDTQKYAIDCEHIFGYFLHHYPYLGLGGEDDQAEQVQAGSRMREIYEATFGKQASATDAGSATAWCAGRTATAWCAGRMSAAWCAGTATPAAADARTAWCAANATAANDRTAWCAPSANVADARTAWCAATANVADARTAWCAATATVADARTAWCAANTAAVVANTAWCAGRAGIATPKSIDERGAKTAWCAGVTHSSAMQTAWCAAMTPLPRAPYGAPRIDQAVDIAA